MANKRVIYPKIWKSEKFSTLSHRQRLLFIGIFSIADDQGRLSGHPAIIRGDVFPFDDIQLSEINDDLDAISETGSIHKYSSDGKTIIQIVNWWKYQTPPWAYPSDFPPPSGWIDRLRYQKQKEIIKTNWEHKGGFVVQLSSGLVQDKSSIGLGLGVPSGLGSNIPSGLRRGQGRDPIYDMVAAAGSGISDTSANADDQWLQYHDAFLVAYQKVNPYMAQIEKEAILDVAMEKDADPEKWDKACIETKLNLNGIKATVARVIDVYRAGGTWAQWLAKTYPGKTEPQGKQSKKLVLTPEQQEVYAELVREHGV